MSSADLDTALWVLGRGTGIVALVLLTLSLCLGIAVRSRERIVGLPRFGVTAVHRSASLTACTLVALHVLTLLLDQQAGLHVVDVLVPFVGGYRPFWTGLGTLGLEILVAVALSGLLRKRIGERAFRGVHLASYALWPVAFAHGLGTGTDAGRPWMVALDVACLLSVLCCLWWRMGASFGRPSASNRLQDAEPLGARDLAGREALIGQPAGQ